MPTKYPGNIISLGGPENNSVYLNGASSQYLSVAKNAALEPTTNGAWTLETWVNATSNTSGIMQIIAYANSTVSSGPDLGYFITHYPGNYIDGGFYSSTTQYRVASPASYATIGSWQHVALVSTGTTMSLYINGVSVGTPVTVTGVAINAPSSATFKIGNYSSNQYLSGYVSNTRFVKGTAVYTSNFVPPTGPLQNISGTGLLTCQSPTIIDNSSNAFTVTNNNGATVSTNTPLQAYNVNNLNPALGSATPGVWGISQALQAEQTRSWPMYDPYYNNVVLNLHGNGTNTAQNNTFLDSSSNNFTITRNGDTTQGSFNPYRQNGYWGNYFNGSTDYLTFGSGITFGSSDYTLEFWAYKTSTWSAVYDFLDAATNGLCLYSNSSGTLYVTKQNVGGTSVSLGSLASLSTNTWYHFAIVRSSGNVRCYVNGTALQAAAADSNNYSVATTKLCGSTDGYFGGYISNARLATSPLYSISGSTITVPTTPLSTTTGVQLLVCQSNRFVDVTGTQTITVSGTPSVQAFQPFLQNLPYESSRLGGSGYFDGTTDTLQLANNAAFNPGAGDWCAELWIYPTYSSGADKIAMGNFTVTSYPTNCPGWDILCPAYNTVAFRWGYPNYADSGAWATQPYAWNHVAVSRSGGRLSLYVNGTRVYTTTSNTSISDSSLATYVGASNYNNVYNGYITDARIVKGSTPYDPTASTITVPTAPLTAITNTQLLCKMTNGAVFDNAAMNDWNTASTAQISTSQSKYGGSSLFFNGPGNYLLQTGGSSAWNNVFGFGSGAWTLECWVYITNLALAGGNQIYGDNDSGTNNGTYGIAIDGSGHLSVFQYTSATNGTSYTTTAAISANTWNHIAVSKNGASAYLAVNGVVQAFTMSASAYYSSPAAQPYIASQGGYTSRGFQGYIDDLRVTKGVARYTSNFQPPTSQLQDQ